MDLYRLMLALTLVGITIALMLTERARTVVLALSAAAGAIAAITALGAA